MKRIFDNSYNVKYYIDGNTILDSSYSTWGHISGDAILNASYDTIGYFKNNTLYDPYWNVIGHVEGPTIYDPNYNNIGSCFITTATMQAKGVGDNCFELEALRSFRNNYILQSKDGEQAVKKYYDIAPSIVKEIEKDSNSQEIYQELYSNLVQKSLILISKGSSHKAFENYEHEVDKLDSIYKPSITDSKNKIEELKKRKTMDLGMFR